MKTAFDCYHLFEKLIELHDVGHCCKHSDITIEQMNQRLDLEKLKRISRFDISEEELFEQMLFCAEDNAERIRDWLYHGTKRQEYFLLDCEKPIGTIIYRNKSWCNRNIGVKCSRLQIILTKYIEKDGDISFHITTSYCELTDDELKQKEAN